MSLRKLSVNEVDQLLSGLTKKDNTNKNINPKAKIDTIDDYLEKIKLLTKEYPELNESIKSHINKIKELIKAEQKFVMYKELVEFVNNFGYSEDMTITVYDSSTDEYYPVKQIRVADIENGVLDAGHPYLVI